MNLSECHSISEKIVIVRKSVKLRTLCQIESDIRSGVEKLISNHNTPIEKFTILAGRQALKDILRIKTESDVIRMVTKWIKISLREPENDRRFIVSQIGSMLLTIDPSERT